jgi:methylthioribose-1-phosphate isomerase
MQIDALEWRDGHLVIIDQTQLPENLNQIALATLEDVEEAIRSLRVRGAPAIGIAAAYGAYLGVRDLQESDYNAFAKMAAEVLARLKATRPTAVNLPWAMAQMESIIAAETLVRAAKARIIQQAQKIHADDRERSRRIGLNGAKLISQGCRILTHCNTGILVGGGMGTALACIYQAWAEHGELHVYADETRPLLQGSRLTAWELEQAKIPVTLIADSMAAWLMRTGKVDIVLVGADRIAANGDSANKIGTYGLAVQAKHHQLPFYVAAPLSTFDPTLATGADIAIEERQANELRFVGKQQTAPENVDVFNPAFDVTPADLISAIICEDGIIENKDFPQITSITQRGDAV